MKIVWIILVNYNSDENIGLCLSSIKNLRRDTYSLEVVIVDNKSKENSLLFLKKFIKSEIPYAKLIESKKNMGFSGGNNIGINYAVKNNADYVILLNPDTKVDKNLVEELLSEMEKDNQVGIVVPKIYFEKGFEFHKEKYTKDQLGKVIWYAGGKIDWDNVIGFHRGVDEVDKEQYDTILETELATGCCMLVKTEIFKKVGLLDERYFLYYEDADFSMRVKKSGYRIQFVPKAVLWHKNAGSTGGSGSDLQDYFITRNRMLFARTYASVKSKLSLIKESFKLLISGRKWQKKGVIDYYLGNFYKGSFPV